MSVILSQAKSLTIGEYVALRAVISRGDLPVDEASDIVSFESVEAKGFLTRKTRRTFNSRLDSRTVRDTHPEVPHFVPTKDARDVLNAARAAIGITNL